MTEITRAQANEFSIMQWVRKRSVRFKVPAKPNQSPWDSLVDGRDFVLSNRFLSSTSRPF